MKNNYRKIQKMAKKKQKVELHIHQEPLDEFIQVGDALYQDIEAGVQQRLEEIMEELGLTDDEIVGVSTGVTFNMEIEYIKGRNVKSQYKGGKCPDCGEEIPDDAIDGEDCSNCGHIFYLEREDNE